MNQKYGEEFEEPSYKEVVSKGKKVTDRWDDAFGVSMYKYEDSLYKVENADIEKYY